MIYFTLHWVTMSLHSHLHHHIAKHIAKHHRHRRDLLHAIVHHLDTIEHSALCIVLAVGFVTTSLWAWTAKPTLAVNTSLVYPVRQVSTLPCRALLKPWAELDAKCKVNLPRILNANYSAFRDVAIDKDTPMSSVYTVLRGATYKWQRDMGAGAHPGLDIASAKGTPLYAIAHGLVTYAGRQNGYGNVVKIMFTIGGEHYHAVYAHMDTINVAKWDHVTQSQHIGTIGNSGNTFGWLGGNHLHFEIDKDNSGRPAYYYAWCEAKKTMSEMAIIDAGACRAELSKYQLDPIAFLEKYSGRAVASTAPVTPTYTAPVETHSVASTNTPSFITLRPLNATKMTADAIRFVKDRDIQIVSSLGSSMSVGQSADLQLYITKKGTAWLYKGALPSAFTIISPTGWLSSSVKSIQYIEWGMKSMTIAATKKWTHNIAVSLGGQTLAVVEVVVK